MAHKKNGFWNFCFSCLPGAGQMFQGFMKRGTSIMVLFFGIIAIASFLHIEEFVFALPVIWCFGFFDSLHRNSLSDEERGKLQDAFLWIDDDIKNIDFKKFRIPAAVALIIIGVYCLWDTAIDFLLRTGVISYDWFINYFRDTPFKVVIAGGIIWFGAYLIRGKKIELDENEEAGEEVE